MTGQYDHTASDAAYELTVAEDKEEAAGRRIRRALRACPTLQTSSPEKEMLWFTLQAEICTEDFKFVRPFGSRLPVMVTEEYATDELLCAMDWLMQHEAEARQLPPLRLFVMLRGVATRSKKGSARAAQADLLHGLTEVPPGRKITWKSLDDPGAA